MLVARLLNRAAAYPRERRDVSWLLVEKVVTLGSALASSVILARYLGPEHFGILASLLAGLAVLLPFAGLGLHSIVTRELVEAERPDAVVLGTGLMMRLIAGAIVLVCVGGVALAFGLPATPALWVWMLFAAVLVVAAGNIHEHWYQARLYNHRMAWLRMSVVALALFAKFAVVLAGAPIDVVFAIVAFEMLGLPIAMTLAVRRALDERPRYAVDIAYAIRLLRASGWLVLAAVSALIYLKIDILMLLYFRGAAEAGIYTTAARLSEVWFQFPVLLCTVVFPHLLTLRRDASVQYARHLQTLYGVLFWSGMSVAVIVSLFADAAIDTLFGAPFSAAADVLRIHVWACVFVFMRALVVKWLIAEHLYRHTLIADGLGALVNVGLNLVLIPIYGGIGAAISTLVAYATASLFAMHLSRETRPAARMMWGAWRARWW